MTNRSPNRRDPQKGKKEFSNKGFTVIELMVVVAVIAIITSLALPSYRTLIEKREVTSGAEQLSAFLGSAKMESVKRNEQIAIYRDNANQCVGFYSYDPATNTPDKCDCMELDPTVVGACAIDEFNDGSAMRLHALNTNVLNSSVKIEAINLGKPGDFLVFDPTRGMLRQDYVSPMPLEVQLKSQQDTYALNVRLSATGRISICSDVDGADYAVPGFDECEG